MKALPKTKGTSGLSILKIVVRKYNVLNILKWFLWYVIYLFGILKELSKHGQYTNSKCWEYKIQRHLIRSQSHV